MGYLTVNGILMSYDEYKDMQDKYKKHGLMQFVKLYKIHKDRHIKEADLHWGEEIEYHIYKFDEKSQSVKLACDGNAIIEEFNTGMPMPNLSENESEDLLIEKPNAKPDFKLLPEFGNWMIEAVPSEPYGAYSNAD